MLVSRAAVDLTLHEWLPLHIQLTDAVEHDVYMMIAASVSPVCMRADKNLVSRKKPARKFHSKCVCPLCIQITILAVLRIEAENIMMRLDIVSPLVLVKLPVCHLAFLIKREGSAVDAVDQNPIPHDKVPVLIAHRLAVCRMLKEKIFQCLAVVGILNGNVFYYSHDIHLPILILLSAFP